MANNKIIFTNPHTGIIREAPVGFSWTVLSFGCFPPLFRSDWKWGVISLLLALGTYGISSIILAFFYNKLYIKDLISAGFKATSVQVGRIEDVERGLSLTIPKVEAVAVAAS